jgi:hypothetical protein
MLAAVGVFQDEKFVVSIPRQILYLAHLFTGLLKIVRGHNAPRRFDCLIEVLLAFGSRFKLRCAFHLPKAFA